MVIIVKDCKNKKCTQNNPQPIENFHKHSRKLDGLDSWCKECKRQNNAEWFLKNRDKQLEYYKTYYSKQDPIKLAKRSKNNRLKLNFNITLEEYNILVEQQNNLCAICNKPSAIETKFGVPRELAVDHDRNCCNGSTSCGKCIRGLLCFRCNVAIGLLNDDIEMIENMLKYLKAVT